MRNPKSNISRNVKDKNGTVVRDKERIMERWIEHFQLREEDEILVRKY